MEIVFIISLVFCIIPASLKGIIHVTLDVRNGHKVDFARSKGYVYLLPYDKVVSGEDEKLKRICNYLQRLSIFSLIVFIIIFLVRFILSQ
jgi:hypothetical protein